MKIEISNAPAVVKRMVYLAWVGSAVSGMGFLQDRGPDKSEEEVWEHAFGNKDYALSHNRDGSIYCDYVMGRMMKLRLKWDGNSIVLPDVDLDPEYQSWCGDYASYTDLLNAARESMATV